MKFATLDNGRRDGQLVLVSADLTRALPVPAVAATLQALLDDWARLAPRLEPLAQRLNEASVEGSVPFDARRALAPLPRAYQWADASAYLAHVERARRARQAQMPPSFLSDPLIYQGGSDDFLAPMADAAFTSTADGIDFEAEVAVVTDDVPLGTTAQQAREHIRLVMLVNDWSLRNLIPAELAKGFGFFQSKPATSFAPVAVTPDELGPLWGGAQLRARLHTWLNGEPFGQPDAGVDMQFDFAQLLAHITRTRNARAGTIVGSGTVANYDPTAGCSCIAERRALEMIAQGVASTAFLAFGDRVRIEVFDAAGRSVFGAIDQRVVAC
ncbi:MAG: fumarylacetoacetate hydrolase family protein [Steroidobacteraceae bacterium]